MEGRRNAPPLTGLEVRERMPRAHAHVWAGPERARGAGRAWSGVGHASAVEGRLERPFLLASDYGSLERSDVRAFADNPQQLSGAPHLARQNKISFPDSRFVIRSFIVLRDHHNSSPI